MLVLAGDITLKSRARKSSNISATFRRPAHRQAGDVDREMYRHAPRQIAGPRSASAFYSVWNVPQYGARKKRSLILLRRCWAAGNFAAVQAARL